MRPKRSRIHGVRWRRALKQLSVSQRSSFRVIVALWREEQPTRVVEGTGALRHQQTTTFLPAEEMENINVPSTIAEELREPYRGWKMTQSLRAAVGGTPDSVQRGRVERMTAFEPSSTRLNLEAAAS